MERHYLEMRVQQAVILAGHERDKEAVHDMRVAVRRIRVGVGVFKPYFPVNTLEGFRKSFKEVGHTLGPLRDVDVLQEKTDHYLAGLGEEQHAISEMQRDYSQLRRELRERAHRALTTPEINASMDLFTSFLRTQTPRSPLSVAASAPQLIEKQLLKVMGFAQNWHQADYTVLHRLRIAFKRLRYSIEFFEEVLGDQQYAAIALLKEIQDHLGDLNDAHVALQFLSDLSAQDASQQMQAYFDSRRQERNGLIAGFPKIWQRFTEGDFESNLQAAMKKLAFQ